MTDFAVDVDANAGAEHRRYRSHTRRVLPDSLLAEVREMRQKHGWSLRKLAKEFGVSHETIRTALRET